MAKWQDQFQKIKKIGQGSSAQIYLVLKKDTKQQMAAKIIKNIEDQSQINALQTQIKILTNCKHPNIIRCYGVQLFEGQLWILMEYCQQGSLSDIMRIRKLTYNEQQISAIMSQLLEGICFLHQKNIIHRDLKASNILYHKGSVKIADFGISVISEGTTIQPKFSRIGSPFWMSPEILSQSIYKSKSDIWALGITAIELAQGQPPYSHQHPFRAIYSIQTHPPQSLKQPQKWSKEFNDFIKKCLIIDHNKRPSAEELLHSTFISKSQRLEYSQNSMSKNSKSKQNAQDTIIMYDQQPLSIWQKDQFQQTQEKINQNNEMQDTVVIRQSAEQSLLLFSDFKNQETKSAMKQQIDKENKRGKSKNSIPMQQRQKKARQLYNAMQEEIKSVRRRYMQKISQLYITKFMKTQQKQWNSPIKKLKDKNHLLFNNQNSRSTSEVFKKML